MLRSQSAMVSLCRLEPADEAATAAAATAHRDDVFVALPDVVAQADHAVVQVVVLGVVASVVEAVAAVVSNLFSLEIFAFCFKVFPFSSSRVQTPLSDTDFNTKGPRKRKFIFPPFRCLSREFSSRTF